MLMEHKVEDAVRFIRNFSSAEPEVAMILGIGIEDVAEEIENSVIIDYTDIPHFPVSTIEDHKSRLIIGDFQGKKIVAMQGCYYYYEGHNMQEVTFAVRVMARLGVKQMLLTNASGAVNKKLTPGDLVLLSDHINFMGMNPLRGHNCQELGSRFSDMSDAYSKDLRGLVKEIAKEDGIDLREGIYAGYIGPSYETPAEVSMLRILGADITGMCTVPEVIVANHAGIKCLGISCVINMAAGILDEPLCHEKVSQQISQSHQDFVCLIRKIIKKVF